MPINNKGLASLWGYPLIDEKARNAISDTRSNLENSFQKKTDDTLGTTDKTVPGAINEVKNSIDTIGDNFSNEQTDTKYDMKYKGKSIGSINMELTDDQIVGGNGSFNIDLTPYQTKTDTSLTTTDKTIKGAINEVNAQCKDIENGIDFLGTSYSNFTNFANLEDYIVSKIVNNGGTNHDRGTVVVEFPVGEYTIKDVNILSKYARRTGGLTFKGAGSALTIINFEPSENEQYLFLNNDIWLNLRFEGIQFKGNIDKNTSFMKSIGNGGAQNYVFKDCFFVNWNNILDLKGTDCNSEMSFYSCNFNGVINNVLYVGKDVTQSGDQFLNYNFFACNYEVSKGNFINMYRGGNINIYGGSFIHTQADSETCEGGTFFNFPNATHSYSTCRLLVEGVRFEFRNRNSKLIDCKWSMGNIEFLNCDGQCYLLDEHSKNWINAVFDCILGTPSIVFDNCALMGKHKYIAGTEGYTDIKNIIYQNCQLPQAPQDFIVFDSAKANAGSVPNIKFKNNKSFADCDLNSLISGRAVLTKKYLSVKDIFGSLPNGNNKQVINLPLNSIITGFRVYLPANAMTSATAVKLKLETTETTPTVLFNSTDDEKETMYYQGFDYNKEMFFVCDTIEKATLNFIDFNNLDQTSTKSICLIEYI